MNVTQEFTPALRRLRVAHRSMVVWLVVVFVALTALRLAIASGLVDGSGGLSAEDISRLRLADIGLALVAMGAAIWIVTQRFHGAMGALVETTERVDSAVAASASRSARAKAAYELMIRAVSHASARARRVEREGAATAGELRALTQSILRVSDISLLSEGRASEESARFDLQELVLACVRDMEGRGVSVSLSFDENVPSVLRGAAARLERALTALLKVASVETRGDALSLRVSGAGMMGSYGVVFFVAGAGVTREHPAWSNATVELSEDGQLVKAMVKRIGGRVEAVRHESSVSGYELVASFDYNVDVLLEAERNTQGLHHRSRNEEETASAVIGVVESDAIISEMDVDAVAGVSSAKTTVVVPPHSPTALPAIASARSTTLSGPLPERPASVSASDSMFDDLAGPLDSAIRGVLLEDAPLLDDALLQSVDVEPEEAFADDASDAETGVWQRTQVELVGPPTMRIHPVEQDVRPGRTPMMNGALAEDAMPVPTLMGDVSGWAEAAELIDSSDLLAVSESAKSWTVRDTQLVDAVPASRSAEVPIYAAPEVFGVAPSPRVERTDGTTPVVRSAGTELGRERRILVVDDDAMARWSLTGKLSLSGFAVDAVAGGKRALEMLSKRAYDAVLLDTYMPDMNGFETAARIRATEHSRIPIIGISDMDSVAELGRCESAGIDELLKKPVEDAPLVETLNRLIDAYRAEDAAALHFDGLDAEVLLRLEGIQAASEQSDLVQRMVITFIERAETAFRTFDLGFDNSDPALIRDTAERLRRSCATLGAVTMEELSGRVSSALERGELQRAKPLVASLEAEFERVRPALLARM